MAEILNELAGQPASRRQMNLFYLIDTSGSMSGPKIQQVNQAMREIMPMVADISEGNGNNAYIRVAILTFDTECRWLTTIPVDAKDHANTKWVNLSANGLTELGLMCEELEKKLHRKEFLNSETGHMSPAFILLSDGESTDPDWRKKFDILKKNAWFKTGIKVAIAIGNDADENMLAEFVGNREKVITVHTLDGLKQMLKVVSCAVSQVGSQSTGAATSTNEEKVMAEVKQEAEESESIEVGPTQNPWQGKDEWD